MKARIWRMILTPCPYDPITGEDMEDEPSSSESYLAALFDVMDTHNTGFIGGQEIADALVVAGKAKRRNPTFPNWFTTFPFI